MFIYNYISDMIRFLMSQIKHICNWIFLHSPDITICLHIIISILESDPKYIISDYICSDISQTEVDRKLF